MAQPFAQRTDGSRGNPIPLNPLSEPKLDRDLDDTFPASDPVSSQQLVTAAPAPLHKGDTKGAPKRPLPDKTPPNQSGGARKGDQGKEQQDGNSRARP